MAYRNSTDNLFALILVLVISLITVPVFAMPAHHSHISTAPNPSDHPMRMAGNDDHPPHHQMAQAESDCCSEKTVEMSPHCSDCEMSHCKTSCSALLFGATPDANLPHEHLVPRLVTVHPVSRPETLLRPPIL